MSALVESVLELTDKGMQDSDRYLLRRVLALCPFSDDPGTGIAVMRDVLARRRLGGYERRDLVVALGESRSDAAVELLCELASDWRTYEQCEGQIIDALATLDTARAREVLLSLVDAGSGGPPAIRRPRRDDVLVARLVELAQRSSEAAARMLELCQGDLSGYQRRILSMVLGHLGTPQSLAVNLALIDDSIPRPIPQGVQEQVQKAFLGREPHGQHPHFFSVQARASNDLRMSLFEMAVGDQKRHKSAAKILGRIEMWRLEHGRPIGEPRHPDPTSGRPWPPD